MPCALQTLSSAVRQKAYKKRALGSMRMTFSSDLDIAVQLFAMVQPAKRPSPQWLEARNTQPLRSETAYICNDTGAGIMDCALPSATARQYKHGPRN